MFLEKFSDIYDLDEYTEVEFRAKVNKLIENTDYNNLIVLIYDGHNKERFTCYTGIETIKENLLPNKVYHFKGKCRGSNRRYFQMSAFNEVSLDFNQEFKYFPENFNSVNDRAKFIYDTSIAKIKDVNIRRLISECLGLSCDVASNSPTMEKLYELYYNSPASLNHHDNYKGGYIVHVAGILDIIDKLEEIYRVNESYRFVGIAGIDFDYLRALAYLHDCGKPYTYRVVNGSHIWNVDNVLGHEQQGVYLVLQSNSSRMIDKSFLQKLIKGILEHMSPTRSNIPEINLFRNIDNIESCFADILNKGE